MMVGYGLPTFERIPGKAVLVDPGDLSQRLKEGFEPEDIQVVFIPSLDVLRQFTLEQLVQLATEYPDNGMAYLLQGEAIAGWEIRPMDVLELEETGNGFRVISVNEDTDPQNVRSRPDHRDLRMERDFARNRLPIERLEELAAAPPENLEEGQLREIRLGVLLMRILSFFAPIIEGMFMFISGKEKSGKSFAMRMVFHLVRWIFLNEDPNAHIVFLAIGERPDELGEFQRLSRDHDRIEFFGTAMDDIPTSKWVYMAYAALERVRRLIELGENVYFFADSLSRLAEGFSFSADNDEAHVTGGHALSAMVQPRAFLGVAGVYILHPDNPTCTVVVTGLRDSTPFHDAPTHQMGGTSSGDWTFTGAAPHHPKLAVGGDSTSTRALSRVKLTELERWFIKELRARLETSATTRGKFDANVGLKWLVDLFSQNAPRDVMIVWDRERRLNELINIHEITQGVAEVLVAEWDLSVKEALSLLEALNDGKILDLGRFGVPREAIIKFLSGDSSREELMKPIRDWEAQFSNEAYTKAVDPDRSSNLSSTACNPLRDAEIPASQVAQLMKEGYEFSDIKKAAEHGAGPDNIRSRLTDGSP